MILYKITNILNNKIYIGQTIQLNHKLRWNSHINNAKLNKNGDAITQAIRKYGKDNFKFEIICKVNSIEELNKLEEEYIKTCNSLCPNGYNIKFGGKNQKLPDIVKQKISKSLKGHVCSKKGKKRPNISKALKEYYKNKGKNL